MEGAERQVKLRNLFAYGMGDIFGGGAFTLIGMFMMIFLTDTVGLSPIWAALVFGVGRFWDAFADPLMGYISDHTHSKFGKRRIFFLVGIIPIVLTFIPLWTMPFNIGPSFIDQFKGFAYFLTMYMIFNTVYSMVMIPYCALNAEMTRDYKVRTRLAAFRMGFSQFSSIFSGIAAPIIIAHYSGSEHGYLIMGITFGIIYALPWFFIFMGTWELPDNYVENKKGNIKDLFKNFGTIYRNKSFRAHLGMYIFAFSALDYIMAFLPYFMKYYIKRPDLLAFATGSVWISQVIVLFIFVIIANKYGKGYAYRIGALLWLISLFMVFTISPGASITSVIMHFTFMGICLSPCYMIPWAVLPSVIDVDELITSKQRSGTYAGAMTLLRKISQGLIVLPSIGIILSIIHYVPDHAQTPQVLFDLRIVFILVPLFLVAVGFLFALRFKITPKTHAMLKSEIMRLRNGGEKENVEPVIKETCETLTGLKYENLYDESNTYLKKRKKKIFA